MLCSSLADKLDVMRDEKTSKATCDATRSMNDNRVNGSGCSQLADECNGYTNEPEPTREQARHFQNEGSGKDKTDRSVVIGSVICSSEGHVLKTKFENMEKELSQVKEELNKVCTEKSHVSFTN